MAPEKAGRRAQASSAGPRTKIKDIETQTDRLLERIVEAGNAALVSAYEKTIATGIRPRHAFADVFERAMRFLSNPWNI